MCVIGEQPKKEKTVSRTIFIIAVIVLIVLAGAISFILLEINYQYNHLQDNYNVLLTQKNTLQSQWNYLNYSLSPCVRDFNFTITVKLDHYTTLPQQTMSWYENGTWYVSLVYIEDYVKNRDR